MITKEQIQKRLAELKEGEAQLYSQLNSCMGNIQDCLHWLAQIEQAEQGANTR